MLVMSYKICTLAWKKSNFYLYFFKNSIADIHSFAIKRTEKAVLDFLSFYAVNILNFLMESYG